MSCKEDDEWVERACEAHYDDLNARGISDQERDKVITDRL